MNLIQPGKTFEAISDQTLPQLIDAYKCACNALVAVSSSDWSTPKDCMEASIDRLTTLIEQAAVKAQNPTIICPSTSQT